MKKRILSISVIVLVIVLALFAFTACNNADSEIGEELVVNGDFSQFENKRFEGWSTSTGQIKYGQSQSSDDGDNSSLYIENSSANYAYVKQTIAVNTNKIYKVSVDMKINTKLSNKTGAYIAFLENVEYKFVQNSDATSGFVTYTFYVKPKNTDYLTIALCLGDEANLCSGKVYFDNVSVQRVNESDVPQNKEIVNFRKVKTVHTNVDKSGITFVVMLTLFSVVAILCAYFIIRRLYANKNAFVDFGYVDEGAKAKSVQQGKWYQNTWFIGAMLLIGTFAIRLILLLTMFGQGSQMTATLNVARSTLAAKNGVFNFMSKYPNSSYAPGVVYILAIIGLVSKGASISVSSILFRLINVFADMAVVGMIYGYGKKHVGNRLSTVYAALYALLPITFVMSGVSCGFESLLVALVVGALILMLDKKYLATYFVMTLASVLDIRAMAVAPLVVAYFVYMYIRDNQDIKKFTANRAKIVFGLVGSVVLAYLITLPIGINQIAAGDAFFNFKVMVGEITNVNYYTFNAFNLYGMVAMNNKSAIQGVKILNLIFLLVLEAYVISLYFKNRNKHELILLASFTFAVIAVMSAKTTYTYLFLSLALAIMYTMVSGDRRMYGVTAGIATLGFVNIAQLLNQSGHIAAHPTSGIMNFETTNAFFITFSVFAVLLIGYYAYVCYSITNNTKIVDIPAMTESFAKTVKGTIKSISSKFAKKEEE